MGDRRCCVIGLSSHALNRPTSIPLMISLLVYSWPGAYTQLPLSDTVYESSGRYQSSPGYTFMSSKTLSRAALFHRERYMVAKSEDSEMKVR
jgi:hypothetical protein